jgi:hypothetical protein
MSIWPQLHFDDVPGTVSNSGNKGLLEPQLSALGFCPVSESIALSQLVQVPTSATPLASLSLQVIVAVNSRNVKTHDPLPELQGRILVAFVVEAEAACTSPHTSTPPLVFPVSPLKYGPSPLSKFKPTLLEDALCK